MTQEKQKAFILRYNNQGLACPRIQYDACEQILDETEEANVAWKKRGGQPENLYLMQQPPIFLLANVELIGEQLEVAQEHAELLRG
jgi:hypothetical protein